MIVLESLLILFAIWVCLHTAFSDWRTGIVSNKVLLRFAVPCLLLDIAYYGFFCRDLLGVFLLNWLLISIISIVFYAVHIWGGGDSKLMILLGMAAPARHYYYLENEAFPILSVVVLIFSVGYLYLVGQSIVYALRKETAFSSKFNFAAVGDFLRDYLMASIYMTFLVNMFTRLIPEFYYDNPVLFLFVNIFVVMFIYDYPVFKSKMLLVVCAVADIVLMRSAAVNVTLDQLWIYLVIAVLFIIRTLVSRYNYQTIPVEELRPGMILCASNVMMMTSSKIEGLPNRMSEDMACRLTAEEVAAVHRWYKRKKDFNTITIVRKIPFAIFIAIGYGLFILLGLIR